jgi:hypothetical protein
MSSAQTQTRKAIDCRDYPDSKCSLTIAGTEDEVLKAATEHAVSSHGHQPGPDLTRNLRGLIKDAR